MNKTPDSDGIQKQSGEPAGQGLSMGQLGKNADWLFWKLFEHARRQYLAWIFAGIALALFSSNYRIGWNVSESLPYHCFILHKGEKVGKGDIVAFPWDGGGKYAWMSPFKTGSIMIKYVLGQPGDTVVMDADRMLYINGSPHAKAKPFTKAGKPLEPLLQVNKPMVIGDHKYYVGTGHFDSMDSRYDMVGLIDSDKFIGKIYVIF